ncbi:MAG: sn-glycerol-3-phosphate ABC transporter ATP-binding protein UgpC [bacterium]|nr:sn-glycerol-3-phosphate ABC transporter ATP-binding protein UgpC [bacterium]
MASVQLDQVTKVYRGERGQVKAVDDVSLEIRDKEFVVLVGPSGCGKSTTLRMIAGLEEVTEGNLRIGERTVNDVAPKDRDIAMVFQNYALYPHMNVFKNMAFGLKMRRVPKREIDTKVREVGRMLGIEHLLNRKPKELSGGERQRVAVGRAIVRNPQAFLFDEPLSNLDARLRVSMRAELKKLHRQLQTTTVYVTHDQEEAMTLGDRIAVMHRGVVRQYAPPLEVYGRPVDRFVAGFVGTPPMNFLPGKLVVEGESRFLDVGIGRIRLPERLGPIPNGEYVLGIRPEGLSFGNGDTGDGFLPMHCRVIEPLGADQDVYLEAGADIQMVARVPADVEVGEDAELRVCVDTARLHLFEPGETGVNVGLASSGALSGAN